MENLPRQRVIIIEDLPDAADVLKELFQIIGYETRAFLSAEEALPHVKTFNPDIIFCDLYMPKMTGFELAKALKNDSTTAHIPLISVSGSNLKKEEVLQAGFDEVLVKPVSLEAFTKALATHLPPRPLR